MTTIRAHGLESIKAERDEDEEGALSLHIVCEDGTRIEITNGRWHEDATNLSDALKGAYESAARIVTEWVDLPDEDGDGFVIQDDAFYVKLEGMWWNGTDLVSDSNVNRRNENEITFATKEIAIYELAAAMVKSGCFPNSWFQGPGSYGTFEIDDAVRAFHDEGGTDLIPLEGVQYAPDDDIVVEGDDGCVVKDYGTLGIVWRLDGDSTLQHVRHENRSTVRLYDEIQVD